MGKTKTDNNFKLDKKFSSEVKGKDRHTNSCSQKKETEKSSSSK
jgi:hypothetical protein